MIDRFRGKYKFLSNFYETIVVYDHFAYGSAEAAFQASKTNDLEWRYIFTMMSPSEAKKAGRRLHLRPDWEDVKLDIMKDILRSKFENPDLRAKLLITGDEYLVEGNTWGDTFWGYDINLEKGENHLGRLLMEIRKEIRG